MKTDFCKAVIQVLNAESRTKLQTRMKGSGGAAGNSKVVDSARTRLSGGSAGAGASKENNAQKGEFIVQYNPATLRFSGSIEDHREDGAEGVGMNRNTVGNYARSMEVELIFASDGEDAGVRERVSFFLAVMMRSPDKRISFSWGKTSLEGRITSMSAGFDVFDAAGNPMHGNVKLRILEDLSVGEDKSFDQL